MDKLPKFDPGILRSTISRNAIQDSINRMVQPQISQQEKFLAEVQKKRKQREELDEKRHNELLKEAKDSNVLLEEQNNKLEEQNTQLLKLNEFLQEKLTNTEDLLKVTKDELLESKQKIDSVNCSLEFILQSIGANSQRLQRDTGEMKEQIDSLIKCVQDKDAHGTKNIITKLLGESGYDNINIVLQIIAIACGFM